MQYSFIIIIWSFLYYLNHVTYPPLKSIVILSILLSTFLCIQYNIPFCYLFLSIILHIIPLLIIDYEKLKIKKKNNEILFINIIVFFIYLFYLFIRKINIIQDYKNFSIFVSKNPSIEEILF